MEGRKQRRRRRANLREAPNPCVYFNTAHTRCQPGLEGARDKVKQPRRAGQIIQEFISGFETHIEDPEKLRNCLLPCVPRSAADS
ncbi:hypothetical protein MHYP_G00331020 [Metynnis hypsauchen]